MLKYLIALVDRNAPSFCYYKNNKIKKEGQERMSMGTLKRVLAFASSNELSINFLGLHSSLPDSYREEINKFENYVQFIPADEDNGEPDNILILDSEKKDCIKDMKDNTFRNIILRLEKKHLNEFLPVVESLLYKCKRLNLCLLDVYLYDKDDLKSYKSQLDEIGKILVSEYKAGHPVELNFLSDRILLTDMNNCSAGIEHITIGPDGYFYICPGFYYDVEKSAVGNLDDGVRIQNRQLLQIDHAPVCAICDAFHCKRCIYFNKISTLEVNSPSYQQCATAHLERDTSRIMLTELKEIEPFNTMEPIEELDYIDPLLVLTGKVKKKIPGEQQKEKIPGQKRKKIPGQQGEKKQEWIKEKQSGPGDDFILVNDGGKTIKLPRLKQVIPWMIVQNRDIKKENSSKKEKNQTGNDLDRDSVKGLLLEILRTQKQILTILKKELGGYK